MPIPGPHDTAMAEIENTAASVLIKLTTMRHTGPGQRDVAGLRQLLQDYVDLVMKLARETV